MLRNFFLNTSGNFAIMSALTLPVLVGSAGLAIDYTQLSRARTELQLVTDAAVLAAANRTVSPAERKKTFEEMLASADTQMAFTIIDSDVAIDEGLNSIKLRGEAKAKVDLHFLGRTGHDIVSVIAEATQSTKKVELGLVLDNTGSMGQAGIDALKSASLSLVNAIEGGSTGGKDVKIALVPFVTAVNIKGEGFDEAWIDTEGTARYNGWSFFDSTLRADRIAGRPIDEAFADNAGALNSGPSSSCIDIAEPLLASGNDDDDDDDDDDKKDKDKESVKKKSPEQACEEAAKLPHAMHLFKSSGTTWKGCVEARPEPYNLSLTPPDATKPDTLFVPYFAPDEAGNGMNDGGNNDQGFNNSWLSDLVDHSDNGKKQRSTLKYVIPTSKKVVEDKNLTLGPNRACPTPVVPLTNDFQKVRDGINAMKFWNGSGTNISEGLAWGWRVITPEAPYTEAAEFDPENVSKFVVLMTDGRNVSYGNKNTVNKSDFGSYGFLADKRIAGLSNAGQVETKLNSWTLEMCTAMKAQGIQIFTVVYKETNTAVQNLFKSCASDPAKFHMASNTAALEQAFADIGTTMSPLRLVR